MEDGNIYLMTSITENIWHDTKQSAHPACFVPHDKPTIQTDNKLERGRGIKSSPVVEKFKTSKFQNWAAPQPHRTVSPWFLVWAVKAGMCVLTAANPSGNILIRNLADWPRVIIPPAGQLAAATKLPNRPNKRICKLHINCRLASENRQGFHHDKWNYPYGILHIRQAQQSSYCYTAKGKELLARACLEKTLIFKYLHPPKSALWGPFRLMRWVTKPFWDTWDSWWLNVHVQSNTLLLLSIYHAFPELKLRVFCCEVLQKCRASAFFSSYLVW